MSYPNCDPTRHGTLGVLQCPHGCVTECAKQEEAKEREETIVMPVTMPDVNWIISYENGDMGVVEMIDGFAKLVQSGMAWRLQGSYGRAAAALIEGGYISPEGEVLTYPEDEE